MSVDTLQILLADVPEMSMLCSNSLTHEQAMSARAALLDLHPEWSAECCETCEADLFLDLSSVRPDGRVVSFIIHACDGRIDVVRMIEDDGTRLGSYADIAQAVCDVIQAVRQGPW